MKRKEERIQIVNTIIKAIATRGREFFAYKGVVAEIILKNNRLYYKNEYTGKENYLHVPEYRNIKGFHHGGTLTSLVKDFRDYILTGEVKEYPAYGGLMCPHWGYPESDMIEIQNVAIELGYLKPSPHN